MAEEPTGYAGSIEDIRDRMRQAKDDPESGPFAVLLGAGASRSAGIPTAAEMAREVAERKYHEETGDDPPEDPEELWRWLEEYPRCKSKFEEWRNAYVQLDAIPDDVFLRYAVCMGELLSAQGRRELLLSKCGRLSRKVVG